MKSKRTATTAVATALLGACAIAGPAIDPDMSGAPDRACAQPAAAGAETPQCFRLTLDGAPASLASGPLRIGAGQELAVLPTGAAACAGQFSHFVVTGSSEAAGAMHVRIDDALARAEISRRFAWRRPFARRSWATGGLGDPLLNPAAVTIAVSGGAVVAESLCFAGYGR